MAFTTNHIHSVLGSFKWEMNLESSCSCIRNIESRPRLKTEVYFREWLPLWRPGTSVPKEKISMEDSDISSCLPAHIFDTCRMGHSLTREKPAFHEGFCGNCLHSWFCTIVQNTVFNCNTVVWMSVLTILLRIVILLFSHFTIETSKYD